MWIGGVGRLHGLAPCSLAGVVHRAESRAIERSVRTLDPVTRSADTSEGRSVEPEKTSGEDVVRRERRQEKRSTVSTIVAQTRNAMIVVPNTV